jgi:hypothetical protein
MNTQGGHVGSTYRADELVASLFDGSVADPYPVYEELREIGDGIHWAADAHGYLVCRYDDVRAIGSDPGLFSSDVFLLAPLSFNDPAKPDYGRFFDVNSRLFMFSDPPIHTRMRSSFRQAFTPVAMRRWRPLVERETARLFAEYQPGDELDFMTLADAVPVAVIAAMLGIPRELHPRFREWSIAYTSAFDPIVQGERRDEAVRTSLELMDYLGETVRRRRAEPSDDLISVLAGTETTAGDYLEDIELVATLTLLLVAGNETTTKVISSALALLLNHPDAMAELVRDPAGVPDAIEEVMRHEPPIQFLFRKATRETQLGDHTFSADTMILPCLAAANRDPRRFDDPLAFDIRRPTNRHVAFFHGIHFCVGAALARLEAAVVIEYVLKNYPQISFGKEQAVRGSSNSAVRGWETLPVRL